jgi:hypothetical protein
MKTPKNTKSWPVKYVCETIAHFDSLIPAQVGFVRATRNLNPSKSIWHHVVQMAPKQQIKPKNELVLFVILLFPGKDENFHPQ